MGMYEVLKDAINLAQKADNLDLYRQLLEVQREAQAINEENLALRKRVAELEEQEKIKDQLEFDRGVYWGVDDDGERDGPFCQLCADRDGMLIRLQDFKNGYFGCQSCEKTVDHPDAMDGGSEAGFWRGR